MSVSRLLRIDVGAPDELGDVVTLGVDVPFEAASVTHVRGAVSVLAVDVVFIGAAVHECHSPQ